MPYSEVDDLLLGDATFSGSINRQKYIDRAAEEIDSKLGFIYTLPLVAIAPLSALPTNEALLLKTINNRLASGELILAMSIGGEDANTQAYGRWLIETALSDLMMLANYTVELSATRLTAVEVSTASNFVPSIVNHDTESAVSAFENNHMRGEPWYWRPGEVQL